MSAFICGDKHISSLVNWFCKNTSKLDVKQSIANKLKEVNILSVNYRYTENTPIEPCSFNECVEITPEMAYKMANCLDYQSCELENYKNPLLVEIIQLADELRDKKIEAEVWYLY
jgi:hypothetical protein